MTNEQPRAAHTETIPPEVLGIPETSPESGYLICLTRDVDELYSSIESKVLQILSTFDNTSGQQVIFFFLPPRVSERLAEKSVDIHRVDLKKKKIKDVLVGEGHSLVKIRKYTILI